MSYSKAGFGLFKTYYFGVWCRLLTTDTRFLKTAPVWRAVVFVEGSGFFKDTILSHAGSLSFRRGRNPKPIAYKSPGLQASAGRIPRFSEGQSGFGLFETYYFQA